MKHRTVRRSRPGLLLWGAGVAAAAVLFLGVSGTLASWTEAVISNSTNTTATGQAVVLQATPKAGAGSASCSTSSDTSNSITCTTINHYGGTTTPLMPGDSKNLDVTFKNTGLANGASFTLTPGTCSSTGPGGATNLCTTANHLKIAIQCSPGSTFNAGTAWSDLSYAAGLAPTATKSHTGGGLNANAEWTCRATVSLDAGAGIGAQSVTVSQPLTWKLEK